MWPSAVGANKEPWKPSTGKQSDDDINESNDLGGMWPSQKPKESTVNKGMEGGAGLKELEEKLKKAKEEHEKDKNFYEDALETRMNQMEELEEKNEKL